LNWQEKCFGGLPREGSQKEREAAEATAIRTASNPGVRLQQDLNEQWEQEKMKKLSALALALAVTSVGAPILMQAQPQEMQQEDQKPKLMNIKGTVRADGDKITLVADGDSKSWDVVNPETVKDHVGHHVELSAHVYADKGQLHVMKVTML
jgi:hypothetical protein